MLCKIIIYNSKARIWPIETSYTGCLKELNRKINHMKNILRGCTTDKLQDLKSSCEIAEVKHYVATRYCCVLCSGAYSPQSRCLPASP